MTKINEDLSPAAHKILKDYQHSNGIGNQGEALNKILIRFAELLEAENETYWEPCGLDFTGGFTYKDGDKVITPHGEHVIRTCGDKQ